MDRSTRRRSGSPPGPPSFLFFTLPRFLPFHAAESLIGLVWSNIFWVGLWDLVSSTVFPNDSPVAMSVLFFLGTAGLFFTNALYEESPEDSGTASAAVTHLTPPGSLPDDTAAELGARRASEVAAEEQRLSDTPFLPPRWEPRRLGERILSNVCSVFCWVGVWDQIDYNLLPHGCSYNACGRCTRFGQLRPCAYYKLLFVILGLVGMYCTRSLYTDDEVAYAPEGCPCCGSRLREEPALVEQEMSRRD